MKKRHDTYAKRLKDGTEAGAEWYERTAYNEYKRQQDGLKESNKVCAFCQEHGHRVNTCPDRLATVEKLKELDEWFIPLTMRVLEAFGMGEGSLVRGSGYVGDEYNENIPLMVTKLYSSANEGRGGLSVVNLWEGDWVKSIATNMITMRQEYSHLPNAFRIALYKELFSACGFPIDSWDWSESTWNSDNKELLNANEDMRCFGSIPYYRNKQQEDYILSPMSSAFEADEKYGWDFKKKSQVNRLFRNSKNGLVEERHAHRINELYRVLKERGVL